MPLPDVKVGIPHRCPRRLLQQNPHISGDPSCTTDVSYRRSIRPVEKSIECLCLTLCGHGIAYQRYTGADEEIENRRLELLDRSSLHAVDSFFNVMRQRVSYFHRAGLSRSSGSFYNAFQPYRPDMVQKIVDIARIYFNWVEPRPFRLSRKFKGLMPTEFDTGHDELETVHDENVRQTRREEFSTPAMRMYLAKRPVRLETILYTDWREKLMNMKSAVVRRTRAAKNTAPNRNGPAQMPEADNSAPF